MEIKVLGTQSPIATLGHNCPGFLITEANQNIMLDCGSGSHRLLKYPEDLKDLHVIITHLHRDHYNDIYNLQYASYVFEKQQKLEYPIQVYLPETPKEKFDDIVNEHEAFAEYNVINEAKKLTLGMAENIKISFLKTDHPIDTYAVKICDGFKTLVYTSDTSFSAKEKLVEFAKDVDLLICESSLLKNYGFPKINSHLTAEQAGIIAKEANVKLLMLTHFWYEEEPVNYVLEAQKVFPRVIAAREEDIIDLAKL